MSHSVRQALVWTPRVLSLLFALFMSIFAFDIFSQGYGIWGAAAALLMHLIPVSALLIAAVVGWRWDWLGALLFAGFGVWYIAISWGPYPAVANLVGVWPIAAPPLLISFLFMLSWLSRPRPEESA